MKINEIFLSLQGEGVYQGVPMVFIRMQGCGLLPGCSFCDTQYARDPDGGFEKTIDEVVGNVSKLLPYYGGWVCITGGEPLFQFMELEQLVRKLKEGGYKVTVETNGSYKPPKWYTLVDSWDADIKCPTSGVCSVSKEMWLHLRQQDQVKFVVSSSDDLQFVKDVLNRNKTYNATVLISPAAHVLLDERAGKIEEYWNKEWLQECWEFCIENRLRFSLQIHKMVYGNRRGV